MSIKNGIDKELSSLQHESVDDAACILRGLGKGAILAKIELHMPIGAPYRQVPPRYAVEGRDIHRP